MKYIKIKLWKNEKPSGRAYTYKTLIDVAEGDLVLAPMGKSNDEKLAVVTECDIAEESIDFPLAEIKMISDLSNGDAVVDDPATVVPDITLPELKTPELANAEEVEKKLNDSLEKYRGIVVTADTLQDCKAAATDLNSWKKALDDTRKKVDKKYKDNLKPFDDYMKGLVDTIEEVRSEIVKQTSEFDDARRRAKGEQAAKIIEETIKKYALKDKYAMQLTMKPNYSNITGVESDIRMDIEARAEALRGQQAHEEDMIKVIEKTLAHANEQIQTKLFMSDFQQFIDRGADISAIIDEINARAEKIYQAENMPELDPEPIPEPVADPEPIEPAEQISEPEPEPTQEPEEQSERNAFMVMRCVAPVNTLKALNAHMDCVGIYHETVAQGWAK